MISIGATSLGAQAALWIVSGEGGGVVWSGRRELVMGVYRRQTVSGPRCKIP